MKNPSEHMPVALRQRWERERLKPLWEVDLRKLEQAPADSASVWRWAAIHPLLAEIAEHTTTSAVERRVMLQVGPSARGEDYMTTGLVNSAYQYLLPGERARPHRHSMNALRFVLEASETRTIVDGKACDMEYGDLVITPAWTWHEHHNSGQKPAMWLDVVEDYLHRALGTLGFEPGPVHDVPEQYEDASFHAAGIVPEALAGWSRAYSPLFRYAWCDVERALSAAPLARDGSRKVRYTNPVDGGACVGFFDCHAVQLQAGSTTVATRSTASALCVVVKGEGVSKIGADEIPWSARDVFTLPQHCWVAHTAKGAGARLFIVSNREAYRRLGLLREESRA